MNLPDDLKYAETHEWVRTEPDGTLTVGITEYAQESLGEIVMIELPESGKVVPAGDVVATIESAKAASEIHAPVSGRIMISNAAAEEEPGRVNTSPYEMWLFKLMPSNPADLSKLLTAAAYKESIGE